MAFVFQIKVVPGSSKKSIKLDKSQRLTCYLTSQPEKGAANKELIIFLAKTLGLTQAQVTIIAGATGRIKYIKIPIDITLDELLFRFGIEKQLPIL